MPQSNVLITGLGIVSPIGTGVDAYFDSLLAGRSGIRSLSERTDEGAKPASDKPDSGIWIGAPIVDFDPKQHVRPRKALKVMCREIQTAFAAAQLSIDHAGLESLFPANADGDLKPHSIGTVFGSEMFYGPPVEMEDAIKACIREDGSIDAGQFGGIAMKKVLPLWMLKYLPNMPACHVGIALNAQGPNNSLILSDVSGPSALMEAVGCLQRGIAEVMLCGATGTRINTTRINYRGDLPVPEVCDPIDTSSRPHDPRSQGVVGGEAAASLVLESAERVRARGVKPIARIVSFASRFAAAPVMHDPRRGDEPDRKRSSARAIGLAIEAALQDGDVTADEVGLIVSHGMGDPASDAAERQAIRELGLQQTPAIATIAAIGHTGAASGLIDILTGALAIQHQVVPPTRRSTAVADDIVMPTQQQPLSGKYVLCLSHTTSGNATAVVLGQ